MDPIFQALNVTRHTQAAFQYLMNIFQDSLQIWFRPVSSTQALLENCPNAMDDTELKVRHSLERIVGSVALSLCSLFVKTGLRCCD